MEICIVGTGYVGLVTGVCLAEIGHRVVCSVADFCELIEADVELVAGGDGAMKGVPCLVH